MTQQTKTLKCPFHKKIKKEHKVEAKFIALSVCPFTDTIEYGAYVVECSCGTRGPYQSEKELAIKLWRELT